MPKKKLRLADLALLQVEPQVQPDPKIQEEPQVQPDPLNLEDKWADGDIQLITWCNYQARYRYKSGIREVWANEPPPGVRVFEPSYDSVIEILKWDTQARYARNDRVIFRNGQEFVTENEVPCLLLSYIPVVKGRRREYDNTTSEVGIGAGDGLFGSW